MRQVVVSSRVKLPSRTPQTALRHEERLQNRETYYITRDGDWYSSDSCHRFKGKDSLAAPQKPSHSRERLRFRSIRVRLSERITSRVCPFAYMTTKVCAYTPLLVLASY